MQNQNNNHNQKSNLSNGNSTVNNQMSNHLNSAADKMPSVPYRHNTTAIEYKTPERFVLPFLVLVLFITGLIVGIINMTNTNTALRRHAHMNNQSPDTHIYQTCYPDAGCRYCYKSKSFVYEK